MLFPPSAAVTVAVDGRPVRAYHGAYASNGRVYAPLRPFVTGLADKIWYVGDTLIIARNGRYACIRLGPRAPDALDGVYVPLARVARALGASVTYVRRTVEIGIGAQPLGTPTPFDAAEPQVSPSTVFTPTPVPTPRPVWTGEPLPRRTPLPITVPTPNEGT
jgi:hypothetical protein